ncbi:MAG: hypothetical protein KJ911_11610 [Alphaproteobacteria bacterium]|jgi:hypothetical protein|uniref:Uncharacterized protein n=1 Tax=Brevundimonas mediterranea TaxID=74329 RepID=A0A7Z8Y1X6_9CAUL|nr:hypothetical protein [Brevundimonas mediterranea]MBU4197380.1 hypothetical protein [Alphaproteobacteria bacterium]VDC49136.1 hypothetical protein BREV_BREV_01026 [Brevundimonas mediterranea]
MIAAAFALLLIQQTAPSVVWEAPAAETAAETPVAAPRHTVPEWGLADPFGYERARCSPQLRGARTLEDCQAEVRGQLALALGEDLPDALRPVGMAGDCQMTQATERGSPYGLQCGPQSRTPAASSTPQEMDCRPRPVEGGFSSECRPVDEAKNKGLSLRLWGGKDD